MSIIKLITINRYTLAVYYTSSDCYRYSIIDDYATVYEPDDIFYTWEAAEREGQGYRPDRRKTTGDANASREAINTVSN